MAVTAFLGLGVMGYPMAGHLSSEGHGIQVWNRTGSKARAWVEQHPGQACADVETAVCKADFVLMCLGDDPDVRQVADRILPHMKRGATLIDHTTGSAKLARELHDKAAALGINFVDAPVSGGQVGAEQGQLSIMCGGEQDAFDRAEPIMSAYAKTIIHAGSAGTGQLVKMVNQICIAGLVQGLSEGLHFAKRAGLDPKTVIAAISKGAAQSWQMENRWRTMVDSYFDYGFSVNWMRKDLRITLDEARDNGACLPVTALVDQFYAEVQAMDGGGWDTSSLIARLENANQS